MSIRNAKCPLLNGEAECLGEKCKLFLPENVTYNFCKLTAIRAVACKYEDLAKLITKLIEVTS